MRTATLLLAAVLFAGCGGGTGTTNGSSGSTGSPSGSTGGGGGTGGSLTGDAPFAVSSGLAWSGSDQGRETRTFDLSKDAFSCAAARESDGGFKPAPTSFDSVVKGTVSAASIVPGHYPNDAGGRADFYIQLATPGHIQFDLDVGGTVDVESVEPNFKGTFTTRSYFDDGGALTITGSFDAPYCQP